MTSPLYHLRSAVALSIMVVLAGCARVACYELLAPQWGGEGTRSPSQVVVFHGCHDGDTCTFSFPSLPPLFGARIPIRLAGVDTPEIHGRCAEETRLARAAQTLTESLLASAQRIEIRALERDKYFRLRGRIFANGRDVSEALLAAGLARPYQGGTRSPWC